MNNVFQKIYMISFVIIGRNEGWKLPKCIQSVIDTCSYNSINNYEIIYVDSNSTDNSIDLLKNFKKLAIFQLRGDVNAAIARNVGAEVAHGDVFFFIDGDMEINKSAILSLFDKNMKLKYDFVSGDFENYYYSSSDSKETIGKEMYHNNKEIKRDFVTGGLFAINKDKWFLVNGMRNIFKRSQDMDLGLRLSKKNIYLHRLPINLAKHHTISYNSPRLWQQLKDNTHLYGRSLLYRNNLLNLNTLKLMIKQDYSLIILTLTIVLMVIFQNIGFILLYMLFLIIRTLLRKNLKYFVYYVIRDLNVLLGFVFFHPKNKKISYIKIQ